MKIGFFDSGLGGLIILKAVAKELPAYDYEFYGDTAHVPYGDRSEEEIFELTKAGVLHLFERDCALVIVACNTASAETLRRLQDSILTGGYADRRILGVIIPTVEAVCEQSVAQVVLLATTRTVESGKYDTELRKLSANISLTSLALPKLVPLIEGGEWDEAEMQIREVVSTLQASQSSNIILGCTHYSLLKEAAREVVGGKGVVLSQDEIIPAKLANYLERHPEIEERLSRTGTRNIFLTDNRSLYDSVIKNLMGGCIVEER
jgi:glutamate racemase